MNKNKKMIPELRFPEYVNEEKWKEKQVLELGETINGLSGKSREDFGTGKPYVTYKQVFDNSFIDLSICGRVNIGQNENQNTLQKGDILFTTSSETANEVGFASVLLKSPIEATYLNSFCFALRPFDLNEIQPEFSRYLFHSPIYRKSIIALAQGSTRYNISKGTFLNLRLPLPKPKEQQKIASCLSSLDEVIAVHRLKLELLKAHKKGLMQNLFPQKDETVPQYRFSEFVNDGEWEEKTLDKVVNEFIVPMRDKPKRLDGEIPWCRIEDFNGMYLSGSKSDQGVSLETVKEMNLKVYPVNTLLVSCSADLGRCAITQKPLVTNQTFIGLVPDIKKVNIVYLYYVMTNSRNELNARSSGTTISYLSRQQFEKFEIQLPKPQEQQKIASCLSSVDAIITAQTEKMVQLKCHKRGLMQRLFPKNID